MFSTKTVKKLFMKYIIANSLKYREAATLLSYVFTRTHTTWCKLSDETNSVKPFV